MSDTELIERLCRMNSEQAEIIREQALLLRQLGCDEFAERRIAIQNDVLKIKREGRCEL